MLQFIDTYYMYRIHNQHYSEVAVMYCLLKSAYICKLLLDAES